MATNSYTDSGSYNAILLAAQAAGIGANLYAERQKRKMAEQGVAVEQAQNKLRMQEEQLAATEATNASLEQLREVLATQRTIAGARGQNPGQGSALALANKAISAQSADERALGLSSSFRQSQLSNMSRLLGIKKAQARTEFGGNLIKTGLKSFSLNQTINSLVNGFGGNKDYELVKK